MRPTILLLAVSIWAVPAAVSQSVPSSLDKVAAYAGTWKTEIEHLDTKFSKARKESIGIRNDCWSTEGYFACHQFIDGKPSALLVFTYNAKDDVYKSYVIPSDGGDVNTAKLLIKGNVWTFPWEDKDEAGKTYYFQVVNVWSGPNTIEYRREFSEDKVHWTLAAKGHESKSP